MALAIVEWRSQWRGGWLDDVGWQNVPGMKDPLLSLLFRSKEFIFLLWTLQKLYIYSGTVFPSWLLFSQNIWAVVRILPNPITARLCLRHSALQINRILGYPPWSESAGIVNLACQFTSLDKICQKLCKGTLLPISLMNLRLSEPHEPKVSTAIGMNS